MKREAGRTGIAQTGAELHARNQIIAAILSPIRDGRGGRERPHPHPESLGNGLKVRLFEMIYPVDHERRKHVVARIIQDSMIDREQQVIDRAYTGTESERIGVYEGPMRSPAGTTTSCCTQARS